MRVSYIWLLLALIVPTLWFGEEKPKQVNYAIKKIKIIITQTNEPADAVVPYHEILTYLFALAGVQVVPEDVRDYDAILRIVAKGKALGRNYKVGGFLWTGAKVSGTITLELKKEKIEDKFDINYAPWDISPFELPESYGDFYKEIYKTPSGSIASYAFGADKGLGQKLGYLCYRLFGLKPLLTALQDSNPFIINCASLGLIEARDKEAVAPLSELVRNKENSKGLRWLAIWILGEIGYPKAAPVLLEALQETDTELKSSAIEAIGKLKVKEAVEPLTKMLKEQDAEVQRLIIEVLGNIGDEKAIDVLANYLKSQDETFRWKSIQALSKIKCRRSAELLLPLLNDENINIVFNAKVGLAELGAPAVPVLIDALKNNPRISRTIIGEIFNYRLKDPLAIPYLLSSLSDPVSIVREYAVGALVNIGRPAIKPLIDFLRKEKDRNAINSAASALRGITKQNIGSNPDEWQRWWNANKDKLLK